jgi:hypothetical protein
MCYYTVMGTEWSHNCPCLPGEWQLKFSSYIRVETSAALEIRFTNAFFCEFFHIALALFSVLWK